MLVLVRIIVKTNFLPVLAFKKINSGMLYDSEGKEKNPEELLNIVPMEITPFAGTVQAVSKKAVIEIKPEIGLLNESAALTIGRVVKVNTSDMEIDG